MDVTGSRFLGRPEVLRAAHFAADAHAGQVRSRVPGGFTLGWVRVMSRPDLLRAAHCAAYA